MRKSLPKPDSSAARAIAELTGISYARARRLILKALDIGVDYDELVLACVFAGRARKTAEKEALRLARAALQDPRAARLLLANLANIRSARKVLKDCDDPEIAFFVDTSFFGNWRRDTGTRLQDL